VAGRAFHLQRDLGGAKIYRLSGQFCTAYMHVLGDVDNWEEVGSTFTPDSARNQCMHADLHRRMRDIGLAVSKKVSQNEYVKCWV